MESSLSSCVSSFPSVFVYIYLSSFKTSWLVVHFVFGLGRVVSVFYVSLLLSKILLLLSQMRLAIPFMWMILFCIGMAQSYHLLFLHHAFPSPLDLIFQLSHTTRITDRISLLLYLLSILNWITVIMFIVLLPLVPSDFWTQFKKKACSWGLVHFVVHLLLASLLSRTFCIWTYEPP